MRLAAMLFFSSSISPITEDFGRTSTVHSAGSETAVNFKRISHWHREYTCRYNSRITFRKPRSVGLTKQKEITEIHPALADIRVILFVGGPGIFQQFC